MTAQDIGVDSVAIRIKPGAENPKVEAARGDYKADPGEVGEAHLERKKRILKSSRATMLPGQTVSPHHGRGETMVSIGAILRDGPMQDAIDG